MLQPQIPDDSEPALEELWAEIESRFGICPTFFKLAKHEPSIAWRMFRMAEFAYLDNPIPAIFKEMLFTWLSRFCDVRYCVARHCAFLLGRGASSEWVLTLLKEPMPDKAELPGYLRALEETRAPLDDWPEADSELGQRFRVACAVIILNPSHAELWLQALRRMLGPQRYEELMFFLAFVRSSHFWTEVHPELELGPDLEALLHEQEALAHALQQTGQPAGWQLRQRFYDALQDARDSQDSIRAIRDSEKRFRAIFENAAVGIARVAPNGRFLEFNQRLCDIAGYKAEELITKTFGDITHPDDVEADLTGMRRLLASEIETYLREKRYVRKDGSTVWVNLTVSLARKVDGSPDYFISIIEDISARKRAEENLRASEQQFRIMADTAPVMIWMSGTDKLGTFFNKCWLDFTGRAMEAELGNGWAEGVHPEDFERCLKIFATSFEARKPFTMEYRLRRFDGEYRWLLDHGVPRFSAGGDFLGYIGSCMDITERKQAETERESLTREQAARASAEAANRSKDDFLAMVSHELRSPLNAILGYTHILSSGPADRNSINKATAVIERNAKAQLQIIEDLLDSARIIAGKLRIEPAVVDLVRVLESALETVRPAASAKNVTLVADFGPQPEEVFADPMRLQQIVWNLLWNSVKFTPENGQVELKMRRNADHLHIIVSDTGKGIEPEFLPFVFERFRQTDVSSGRRFGGLGLGLSLVKHLVELHGGTIAAASHGPGCGATFTVTLPSRQAEPASVGTQREVITEGAIVLEKPLSLEGVAVLLADDQEETRAALARSLSEYGAHITAVSSGAEALELLANPPGGRRFDVLILDIAMPDEDGYTVVKKVRAMEASRGDKAREIRAIALTSSVRPEDRLQALQAGFDMHVAKPVEPAELAVVVASLTIKRLWERGRKN